MSVFHQLHKRKFGSVRIIMLMKVVFDKKFEELFRTITIIKSFEV